MDNAPKEILAYWNGSGVMAALVPKARGSGFLMVPAGHHVDARITALEEATGASVYGLDGNLEIDTSQLRGRAEAGWADFVRALGRLYPLSGQGRGRRRVLVEAPGRRPRSARPRRGRALGTAPGADAATSPWRLASR